MAETPGPIDNAVAALLRSRWLMRLPIPLYRASLGWMLGTHLAMVEHLGRSSGERGFVVVFVIGLERNLVQVASPSPQSEWYRDIEANGVAYISLGRYRRVKAHARLLGAEDSAARLRDYAREHPVGGRLLHAAIDVAQGADAETRVIEFAPPRDASALDVGAE